jgi:uncharacterized protein with NRDE domain
MCLVAFAVAASSRYPLVIAANRDERHERPTLPAGWWRDRPAVFGGRDLRALGTWLAVERGGRIGAVTNVREPQPATAPRSRGALVADYLGGDRSAADFAAALARQADDYAAFSLLLFEHGEMLYASNRAPTRALAPGMHALSNAPLGAEWPKERSAREGLERSLEDRDPVAALLGLLADRGTASTPEERYRSAHFIEGPVYGTRCSTVILVDAWGRLTFVERSFDAGARVAGEVRKTIVLDTPASGRTCV